MLREWKKSRSSENENSRFLKFRESRTSRSRKTAVEREFLENEKFIAPIIAIKKCKSNQRRCKKTHLLLKTLFFRSLHLLLKLLCSFWVDYKAFHTWKFSTRSSRELKSRIESVEKFSAKIFRESRTSRSRNIAVEREFFENENSRLHHYLNI